MTLAVRYPLRPPHRASQCPQRSARDGTGNPAAQGQLVPGKDGDGRAGGGLPRQGLWSHAGAPKKYPNVDSVVVVIGVPEHLNLAKRGVNA